MITIILVVHCGLGRNVAIIIYQVISGVYINVGGGILEDSVDQVLFSPLPPLRHTAHVHEADLASLRQRYF